MAKYGRDIEFGSKAAATGTTKSVLNTSLTGGNATGAITTDYAWGSGYFGYSVTQYTTAPSSSWAIEIHTNIGTGGKLRIAGVTGINSATAIGFIPLDTPAGTTAWVRSGIPQPHNIDLIGTSTGVGTTFGVVVSLRLNNS